MLVRANSRFGRDVGRRRPPQPGTAGTAGRADLVRRTLEVYLFIVAAVLMTMPGLVSSVGPTEVVRLAHTGNSSEKSTDRQDHSAQTAGSHTTSLHPVEAQTTSGPSDKAVTEGSIWKGTTRQGQTGDYSTNEITTSRASTDNVATSDGMVTNRDTPRDDTTFDLTVTSTRTDGRDKTEQASTGQTRDGHDKPKQAEDGHDRTRPITKTTTSLMTSTVTPSVTTVTSITTSEGPQPGASPSTAEDAASASTMSQLEIVVEDSTEMADTDHVDETVSPSSQTDAPSPSSDSTASSGTMDSEPASTTTSMTPSAPEDDRLGGVIPPMDDTHMDSHNEVLDDEPFMPKARLSGPWLIGTRTASKDDEGTSVLYRNYDVDSQEREREMEERAREQNHPADLEDSNVHEVNHYVPEDEPETAEAAEQQQQQQQRSVARWYLLLLAGNTTTVRLRQKDFAKYLKLNLAARLSVEYNDLRVNRVEFKPLLMVNVTIFSRPKDNEEVPLHMLADTNATLLELSGEEYHVVRFITIPNEQQQQQEALASGGFMADSYTGNVVQAPWHVDMGVAVYFAVAAAFVAILLAVFLVGLWRYIRNMVSESSWRPWRRYKHFELPRWNLPLQHRLCADHIVHCAVRAPLRMPLRSGRSGLSALSPESPPPQQQSVWTTSDGPGDVPVQKILAPEPPRRFVFAAEPGKEWPPQPAQSSLPQILGGDSAPSTADTLLQAQPTPVASARPNSKLSLFGEQQTVVQPDRSWSSLAPGDRPAASARKRFQPQTRHPLDVRIGVHSSARGPTVLGLDNPNYMLQ